jgi:hypothetical protein
MKNPAGKGAVIPGKDMFIQNFDYRFQVLSKDKDFELNIYTQGQDVFYHILVPSENPYRENKYDVIIKFKPSGLGNKIDGSYKQYDIEFFSNSPAFAYTYAYVAKLNGLLIMDLADKYDEKILTYPPTSRNPGLLFNYEKSIYFACKFLLSDSQFLLKSYVKSHSKKLTKKILKEIKTLSKVEEEYKKENKMKEERELRELKKNMEKKEPVKSIGKKETKTSVNKVKKITPNKKKANNITPI